MLIDRSDDLNKHNTIPQNTLILKTCFYIPGSGEYGEYKHKRSYQSDHKTGENTPDNTVRAQEIEKPNIFATENCTIVVAQVGGMATLPCVIRKFNSGVVSAHQSILSRQK